VPRGGFRPGSGRKKGDPKKPPHDVVVENPATLLPVEWMLAVLRDPEVEQRRRDRMAEVLAPYLHPRLAAVEMRATHRKGGGDENINVVQIFAVPRGGSLDVTAGTITVDGSPLEATTIEPFQPTPSLLDALPAPTEPEPQLERLEVIEVEPDDKLAVLDAWRRKKTDE
jgi:hypothetical protein